MEMAVVSLLVGNWPELGGNPYRTAAEVIKLETQYVWQLMNKHKLPWAPAPGQKRISVDAPPEFRERLQKLRRGPDPGHEDRLEGESRPEDAEAKDE